MNVSYTVYIVDGDESARRGLRHLLSAAGHVVNSYASFEKIPQIHAAAGKACLIIDASESESALKKLANTLEKNNVILPIIFLTATDDKQARTKARLLKAVGYFRKPVDGTALLDAIAWALESHEQQTLKNISF